MKLYINGIPVYRREVTEEGIMQVKYNLFEDTNETSVLYLKPQNTFAKELDIIKNTILERLNEPVIKAT